MGKALNLKLYMYKVNVYIYITAIYIFWLYSFTYHLKLRDSKILAKYVFALLFINTKLIMTLNDIEGHIMSQ